MSVTTIFNVKRLENEILPLIDFEKYFGFSFDIENIYNKQVLMDKITSLEISQKKAKMQKERKAKNKKPA
ncbi:MAG: hypothetical protein ABL920_06320 [Methylotenera sp.]